MSAESFRVNKFSRSGVTLLSDYEIQSVPKDVCKVRKSLGLCGFVGVTISMPAIDGSSLVTRHCESKNCGSDVVASKEVLEAKAEHARQALISPREDITTDEHVEELVGFDKD